MAKSIVKDVLAINSTHPMRRMFAAEYQEGWLRQAVEKFCLDQAIFENPFRTPTEVQGLGLGLGPGLGLGNGYQVEERKEVTTTRGAT
jgi:hypothetical protein